MIAALFVACTGPGLLAPLYVIDAAKLPPAEQVLVQTLQGIVNRKEPRIWVKTGGIQSEILAGYDRPQERFPREKIDDPWQLLRKFQSSIKGAILFKSGSQSLNVATSLCGILDAVAIEESVREKSALKVLVDARTMTDADCFKLYGDRFAKGIAVEQTIEKPGHLRDFAVKHRAFVFDTSDRDFRKRVIRALGPTPLVFGWGRDEYQWISDISEAGGTGVAADWCQNLSALENIPAKIVPPKVVAAKNEDGVRYVAFVLSDGDNVQWLTGGFATDPKYYASPLRGQFPMTWEMSPLLARFAPSVLQAIYAKARKTDDFVASPGMPGYVFPHASPDRSALARESVPYLTQSGISTVSVLNQNEGDMNEVFPLLDLPECGAVIYKDYSPYNRRQGAITWHADKPCVAYRFILWEGLTGIDDLVRQIGEMPATPKETTASYALINVHAWSFNSIGGPIKAVKRVIDRLPANTRVVTANQLLALLKKNHPPH